MTAARLAFIRARLQEDREVANGHQQPSASWHADDYVMEVRDDANAGTVATVYRVGDLIHLTRHHPARVLVEVEAKERLLDWLERMNDRASDADFWSFDLDEALDLMARPYADHPDYREEWTP
ncbi:DUF6221 family protein [Streptomyces sp. NPDC051582]|uniref:DUF6221 family protein n=1 Tax=Streptomyces sp. NPDC051582 TaxID=3155167 RepID=UPI00341777B9